MWTLYGMWGRSAQPTVSFNLVKIATIRYRTGLAPFPASP
jgi:hypothetical protein